ncbi:MAG: diguanylate cyclase [Candidatus Omnitrophota bacterium]
MESEINVLIVEDKKEDAVFLESIVKPLGYKVWIASNKDEASALIQRTFFAAVLTELHMPQSNGLEITRLVIKQSHLSSIVVMTAYSFISSAIEVMEEGAYGYITKPFNAAEIKIVLNRAIERYLLLSSDREKEQFAQLSVKDGLTGVYNRRFFNVFLAGKINKIKNYTDKFSILMIDIDDFKKFNDREGHLAGDKLLKEMAKLFQDSVREGDTVFRYGGEEFVVFLGHVDKKGAFIAAERMRTLVNLYEPTTISVGVSTFPEDAADFQELVSRADGAMYKAKESGKNKVCLA